MNLDLRGRLIMVGRFSKIDDLVARYESRPTDSLGYVITVWLIYQRFSNITIRSEQFNAKTHR